MLQLSGMFVNQPVLSLRTGDQIATAAAPIINPNNLRIEGFYCYENGRRKQHLVLLTQDIREIIAQGIVVNDHDVLTEPDELVRLRDIMQLQFTLLDKPVFSANGERLGKVSDYAVETGSMSIQKLYVSQPLLRHFNGGSLSIDRSQIVEITPKKITVHDLMERLPLNAEAMA